MKKEFSIIRQIWRNRGFGKYTLFGGLAFYFRLRIQFFAYLSAFITSMVLLGGVYSTYKNYEPTYWRKTIYYDSREWPIFELKANTYYTFKISDNFNTARVNGYNFAKPGLLIGGQEHYINLPYNLPREFHVMFPYDTRMAVVPELDLIIDLVISEKMEVWKFKQEGVYVPYQIFEPSYYYTPPPQNEVKKNKKGKKKK